jgi:uncharacterized membrane protein YjgN (DUF898 family)
MTDMTGDIPPAGLPPVSAAVPAVAPVSTPPTAPGKIKANKVSYVGKTGALYGVWLSQFALSIITLGVYHFWGKTNLRRFLAGNMELDGDRFEYTGTGKELFKGFLKVILVYTALVVLSLVIAYQHAKGHKLSEADQQYANQFLLPFFLYFLPVAKYSGFRYRINRIHWRGIRGVMTGSALAYGWKYLGGSLLSLITLGLMNPSIDLGRWAYQVKHLRFGNVQYTFKGDPARLRKTNIITLLLVPFTMGMSRFWYIAELQREKLRGLQLGSLRFRSTATGGALLGYSVGNIFILLFTLGFGSPLVLQRTMRLYQRFIAIGGDLQAFNAEQTAAGGAGDAEGLLDVLDPDIGFVDMIGA